MSRRYELFGLILDSDFDLPEAHIDAEGRSADVTIRKGLIDAGLGSRNGLTPLADMDDLFCVPDIARFRCRGGREIIVDAVAGLPERNVRLYLLGSVMGMLLHQRGLLPLHGNAVVIGDKAYVFVGPSGIGKSTLATWFHDKGYEILADDVATVSFEQGRALVHPGLARVRLWKDAVEASGRTADDFPRSYAGDDDWDKFDVPLGRQGGKARPLGAVILLGEQRAVSWERLTGIAAVEAVLSNVYRGAFLRAGEGMQRNVAACLRLVSTTPVFHWKRPRRREAMDQQGAELLRLLGNRTTATETIS